MKEFIEVLPMVTAPVKGETLVIYLATSKESIRDKEMEVKETKRNEPEPENVWKLFTDRSSNSDGFEVGLMLVNSEGKEYTYALRLEFETTNNEA
nr:reverse transcriptase domain-containing protein [Tanacetum cinerariifolium]